MLREQLIGVFVGVVAEPFIRLIKAKFNLSGAAMLLVAVAFAAVGGVAVVGIELLINPEAEPLTLERVVALAPTVFLVGNIIFNTIK
jgi:hypothetical protein